MINKAFKGLLFYIIAAIIVYWCTHLIIHSKCVKDEIISAIERCINIIIPSLFAFMVMSSFIIKSSIYKYIAIPFYPITKYIMKMPSSLFFVFLLGNISGYPVGAKLLLDMFKARRIDKKTAEIAICFCYGGGPAFFTGTIGLAIFNSTKAGLLIFISVLFSNFIIACIMCRICIIKCNKNDETVSFSADYLIDSIISAGKSLFVVCVTILFFSCIMAILDAEGLFQLIQHMGLNDEYCTLIKSILEISYISNLSANSINLIPIIAGLCSFGGVCVIMQVKAIVGNSFSLKRFMLSRVGSCLLSYLITKALLKLFADSIMPALSEKVEISIMADNLLPSICLIIMIFIVAFADNHHTKRKAVLTQSENSL
ncbi:MAG: nucleoside recognition protein [Ruminococcus sp.]|nr:nucleoside recognition protein [Ruminococcus sp.]